MAYDIKQSFLNLARYNERVNREMYEVLSVLTGRARKQEAGSWFGSIHGILNHLIICDLNWLKRYRALSPESPVLTDPRLDPPNLSWDHDLHDNFAGLGKTGQSWMREFAPGLRSFQPHATMRSLNIRIRPKTTGAPRRGQLSNSCSCTILTTEGKFPKFWTVWELPITLRTTSPTLRVQGVEQHQPLTPRTQNA